MSLRETIGVLRSEKKRLKIFIDFWNVVINARSQVSADYLLDVCWDSLANRIVSETRSARLEDPGGELAGCYIFGSFQKSDPRQNEFISHVLDEYGLADGLYFDFKERVPKQTSVRCKKCNEQVTTSSESGVDVLLAVEMIKHATMREHDYLALVSSDRDFMPLLQYLKDQGQRVIHIAPSKTVREMRALTWKQVDLQTWYPQVCKLAQSGYIIFTAPPYAQELTEAEDILKGLNAHYKVIDLTKKELICDKDLDFITKSMRFHFSARERQSGGGMRGGPLFQNIWDLRQKLITGEITAHLPYVMKDGVLEAHGNRNSQYRWITSGSSENATLWQSLNEQKRATQ